MVRVAARSGKAYIPERGDLVWLTVDPQAGHEQAGRRPALILSTANYNAASGLALVVPVTSSAKGYPFEVSLPAGLAITGVVLADHVKSVDWKARKAKRIVSLRADLVEQVRARTALLLE
jgi:mRNA interferase MazF